MARIDHDSITRLFLGGSVCPDGFEDGVGSYCPGISYSFLCLNSMYIVIVLLRVDVDECAALVCNQGCKNLPGGYTCLCDSGYALDLDESPGRCQG